MRGTVASLKVSGIWVWMRLVGCALLLTASDAPPAITPLTVCEILADLPAREGKNVAVLGRYSFRRDARWIGEETCGKVLLSEDSTAPRPPGNFDLDAPVLNKKFAEMVKHTSLGKFRFGSPAYDRWAVVYGRISARKGDDAKKAAAEVMFRGSGVVVFLTTEK